MDVKEIRCDLHQIPELGRNEFKTKEYILNVAKNLNCKIYTPTPTGVCLYFNVGKSKTIAFRADMDALPIKECNTTPYVSQHEGVMHACGHDGHMAMNLAFAIWASDNLDLLEHNIVCLFQPSEEENAGANDILKSNILNELNVSEIYGFHIWPNLENGKIYSMPKGMLATSGEVDIDIIGKSVHAANRELGLDSLLASMSFINAYYDFASEITEPHLISFGKLNSGTARNIVSGETHIEATLRAFDDDIFGYMSHILEGMLNELKKKGFDYRLNINAAYPSVINNVDLFNKYKDLLDINELEKPFLQAEDFGCYTRNFKCLFMLIGCGNDKLLHTNTFDFDMDILSKGVSAYKLISTTK